MRQQNLLVGQAAQQLARGLFRQLKVAHRRVQHVQGEGPDGEQAWHGSHHLQERVGGQRSRTPRFSTGDGIFEGHTGLSWLEAEPCSATPSRACTQQPCVARSTPGCLFGRPPPRPRSASGGSGSECRLWAAVGAALPQPADLRTAAKSRPAASCKGFTAAARHSKAHGLRAGLAGCNPKTAAAAVTRTHLQTTLRWACADKRSAAGGMHFTG